MFIIRLTRTCTSLKYNIRCMMLYYSLKNCFLPLSLMLQNAAEFTRLTATATSALSWCINCARYNKTHLDDCFNCPVMYCTPATSILSWCIVHVLTRLTSTATWTLSWCIITGNINTLMVYCARDNYSHLDGYMNTVMVYCTPVTSSLSDVLCTLYLHSPRRLLQ